MSGRGVHLEPAAWRAAHGLAPRLVKYPGWRGVKRAAPKKRKAKKGGKRKGNLASLAKARAVVRSAKLAFDRAGRPKGQWKAFLQQAKINK